jgi:hypothetical protein
MKMAVLVGVISGGSKRQLVGAPDAPDMSRLYCCQRGEFYTVSDWKPDVPVEGRMENLASGIFRHPVFKDESGEMVFGGIFPPQKTLSLFD